jgi:DNA-binding FadR family transcriptional regulator
MGAGDTPSRADVLFHRLQGLILSGRWEPGAQLPTQKELAEEDQVSVTVVREAIARLVAQGLAVARQGSGVFVAEGARYQAFQVTPLELAELEDVLKLLELRMAIESEMASLAAGRRSYEDLAAMRECLQRMDQSETVAQSVEADTDFHKAIAAATKNEYFQRFLDFLGVRLVPPRSLYLRDQSSEAHEQYARTIAADHRAIFDAIADQDPVRARSEARRHMHESLERHAQLGRAARSSAA